MSDGEKKSALLSIASAYSDSEPSDEEEEASGEPTTECSSLGQFVENLRTGSSVPEGKPASSRQADPVTTKIVRLDSGKVVKLLISPNKEKNTKKADAKKSSVGTTNKEDAENTEKLLEKGENIAATQEETSVKIEKSVPTEEAIERKQTPEKVVSAVGEAHATAGGLKKKECFGQEKELQKEDIAVASNEGGQPSSAAPVEVSTAHNLVREDVDKNDQIPKKADTFKEEVVRPVTSDESKDGSSDTTTREELSKGVRSVEELKDSALVQKKMLLLEKADNKEGIALQEDDSSVRVDIPSARESEMEVEKERKVMPIIIKTMAQKDGGHQKTVVGKDLSESGKTKETTQDIPEAKSEVLPLTSDISVDERKVMPIKIKKSVDARNPVVENLPAKVQEVVKKVTPSNIQTPHSPIEPAGVQAKLQVEKEPTATGELETPFESSDKIKTSEIQPSEELGAEKAVPVMEKKVAPLKIQTRLPVEDIRKVAPLKISPVPPKCEIEGIKVVNVAKTALETERKVAPIKIQTRPTPPQNPKKSDSESAVDEEMKGAPSHSAPLKSDVNVKCIPASTASGDVQSPETGSATDKEKKVAPLKIYTKPTTAQVPKKSPTDTAIEAENQTSVSVKTGKLESHETEIVADKEKKVAPLKIHTRPTTSQLLKRSPVGITIEGEKQTPLQNLKKSDSESPVEGEKKVAPIKIHPKSSKSEVDAEGLPAEAVSGELESLETGTVANEGKKVAPLKIHTRPTASQVSKRSPVGITIEGEKQTPLQNLKISDSESPVEGEKKVAPIKIHPKSSKSEVDAEGLPTEPLSGEFKSLETRTADKGKKVAPLKIQTRPATVHVSKKSPAGIAIEGEKQTPLQSITKSDSESPIEKEMKVAPIKINPASSKSELGAEDLPRKTESGSVESLETGKAGDKEKKVAPFKIQTRPTTVQVSKISPVSTVIEGEKKVAPMKLSAVPSKPMEGAGMKILSVKDATTVPKDDREGVEETKKVAPLKIQTRQTSVQGASTKVVSHSEDERLAAPIKASPVPSKSSDDVPSQLPLLEENEEVDIAVEKKVAPLKIHTRQTSGQDSKNSEPESFVDKPKVVAPIKIHQVQPKTATENQPIEVESPMQPDSTTKTDVSGQKVAPIKILTRQTSIQDCGKTSPASPTVEEKKVAPIKIHPLTVKSQKVGEEKNDEIEKKVAPLKIHAGQTTLQDPRKAAAKVPPKPAKPQDSKTEGRESSKVDIMPVTTKELKEGATEKEGQVVALNIQTRHARAQDSKKAVDKTEEKRKVSPIKIQTKLSRTEAVDHTKGKDSEHADGGTEKERVVVPVKTQTVKVSADSKEEDDVEKERKVSPIKIQTKQQTAQVIRQPPDSVHQKLKSPVSDDLQKSSEEETKASPSTIQSQAAAAPADVAVPESSTEKRKVLPPLPNLEKIKVKTPEEKAKVGPVKLKRGSPLSPKATVGAKRPKVEEDTTKALGQTSQEIRDLLSKRLGSGLNISILPGKSTESSVDTLKSPPVKSTVASTKPPLTKVSPSTKALPTATSQSPRPAGKPVRAPPPLRQVSPSMHRQIPPQTLYQQRLALAQQSYQASLASLGSPPQLSVNPKAAQQKGPTLQGKKDSATPTVAGIVIKKMDGNGQRMVLPAGSAKPKRQEEKKSPVTLLGHPMEQPSKAEPKGKKESKFLEASASESRGDVSKKSPTSLLGHPTEPLTKIPTHGLQEKIESAITSAIDGGGRQVESLKKAPSSLLGHPTDPSKVLPQAPSEKTTSKLSEITGDGNSSSSSDAQKAYETSSSSQENSNAMDFDNVIESPAVPKSPPKVESASLVTPTVPRKRGRPRKIPLTAQTESATPPPKKEVEIVDTPSVTRRGRQRNFVGTPDFVVPKRRRRRSEKKEDEEAGKRVDKGKGKIREAEREKDDTEKEKDDAEKERVDEVVKKKENEMEKMKIAETEKEKEKDEEDNKMEVEEVKATKEVETIEESSKPDDEDVDDKDIDNSTIGDTTMSESIVGDFESTPSTPRPKQKRRRRGPFYVKRKPRLTEPKKKTEKENVQNFEEETRMSASEGTGSPVKAGVNLGDESLSSSMTADGVAMVRNTGNKKGRMEIITEGIKPITVQQIVEYPWPPASKLPPGEKPEMYMIQEQISEYLGVKSFKRKYPTIKRRPVDMEERNYLQENGYVSENMCDMGLTAVYSADILEIMYMDFPGKLDEYRKFSREKRVREAKALREKQAADKDLDPRQEALEAAASWNSDFNKERREKRAAYFDQQTFTVNYPKKDNVYDPGPVGAYPVALLPGQFTDNFKRYTPAELKYFPLNTVLYGPMRPNEMRPEDDRMRGSDGSGSDSDDSSSSGDSSSSSSDSQDSSSSDEETEQPPVVAVGTPPSSNPQTPRTSRTPLKLGDRIPTVQLSKIKLSSKLEQISGLSPLKAELLRTEPTPLEAALLHRRPKDYNGAGIKKCRKCGGDEERNKDSVFEKLICCSSCRYFSHPSCLEMGPAVVCLVESYKWDCRNCKICSKCQKSPATSPIILCGACDRGYHLACVGLLGPPKGRYVCHECTPPEKMDVDIKTELIQAELAAAARRIGVSEEDIPKKVVQVVDLEDEEEGKK